MFFFNRKIDYELSHQLNRFNYKKIKKNPNLSTSFFFLILKKKKKKPQEKFESHFKIQVHSQLPKLKSYPLTNGFTPYSRLKTT